MRLPFCINKLFLPGEGMQSGHGQELDFVKSIGNSKNFTYYKPHTYFPIIHVCILRTSWMNTEYTLLILKISMFYNVTYWKDSIHTIDGEIRYVINSWNDVVCGIELVITWVPKNRVFVSGTQNQPELNGLNPWNFKNPYIWNPTHH